MIRKIEKNSKLEKLFEKIDEHESFGRGQKNYLKKVLKENIEKSFQKEI